uniref:Aminotran_1_2 domain-containing protein n=1 Tax=Parastrongyloides trichosuri TaxID=131310 RepID=A0A0N4ZT50_PARTI
MLNMNRKILSNQFFIVRKFASNANAELRNQLREELQQIKKAGTYKNERIIIGPQGTLIKTQNNNKELLNFCANNYLGLCSHPDVIKAGHDALAKYGAGLASVRFICGTLDIHRQLEQKISKFHQKEDAILYSSCFDANAGIFEVLTSSEDAIVSDELNHASIIDGIRLSKAKRFRYKHLDMNDLEKQLGEIRRDSVRRIIIATDGAYSMDGDIAPLKEICDLADKYNALVFIDECHATGFLGKTGRGTEELSGIGFDRVDIINSTLGKGISGSMGGYTCASSEIINILKQKSRPNLFSNALPPAVVGSALKAFDLLMDTENNFTENLHTNIAHFRNEMKNAGFTILGNPSHPICPILLKDAKLAGDFAEKMLEEGIYVIGFSYPVVPIGQARIRVQIGPHTIDQINQCIEAFKKIGKELKVI